MDAEAVVWLIFIAIWFISGVVRQIKQVASQRPGQEGSAQEGQRTQPSRQQARQQTRQQTRGEPQPQGRERQLPDDDPMVQLLRKLGGEVEVRPQEPPRESPPRPLRRQEPPPPRPSQPSAISDRSRPAKVAGRPKIAEQAAIPPMRLPPVVPTVSKGGGPPSALARSLRRDLRRPQSVRKAILLQEILGKPPGLQGLKR